MDFLITFLFLLAIALVGIVGLIVLFSGWIIVPEKTYVTTTWLGGAFHKIYEPGFSLKMPWPFEGVDIRVSTRIQEMVINSTSLTSDRAKISLKVAVQYEPLQGKYYEAAYKLSDPEQQMKSYLDNQLRSEINAKTVSEIYSSKAEFTKAVIDDLKPSFQEFGFNIVNVLIDEPTVSAEMLEAFERKLVAERRQEAARAEGEAEKTAKVMRAEAEGDALKKKTEAWKEVRNMMAEGNAESLNRFVENIHDGSITSADALTFFANLDLRDAMRDSAAHGSKIIFITKEAGGSVGELAAAVQTQTDEAGVTLPQKGRKVALNNLAKS
jgi:regulator of protease activity HflC (stomatin/prohibitin superfamily)